MILGISGLAGSGKDTAAGFLRTDFKFVPIALADPLKRMAKDAFDFTDEQLWGPSQFRNAPDKRYPREHTWSHTAEVVVLGERVVPTCACCGAKRETSAHREGNDLTYEDVTPPCYLTPRFALQKLGTEFGRACYPNVWVEKTLKTARALLFGGEPFKYTPSQGLRSLMGVPEIPELHLGVAIPDVRFRNEITGIRAGGGKVIRVVRPGAGLAGAAGLHPSEKEQAEIPDEEFDGVIVNDGTLLDLQEKVSMLYRSLSV